MRINRILIVAAIFITFKAAAQDQIIAKGDTLVLPSGSKFWLGEQVTLGSGSSPDRTFNYIYLPEMLRLVKKKPAEANYSGQIGTVKKFQRDGAYKDSYSYNILVLEFSDRRRYWCDIQGAVNTNEIIDPNKKGGGAESKEARLARLQKLYDSGQITKEEYETLKNKILSEKDANPTNKKSSDAPVVF
ncbi:MAG TPA: SHOCT domain-containing protein [Mucilaginibacter sp.]|jgi:hypothetical protein|nr:SHOCT domain-containing protein [Mucilaginibacter sp.]